MSRVPLGQDKAKLRPQEKLYIACDAMDLSFTSAELSQFKAMWLDGLNLVEMGKEMHRDADELAILCIDQARKNKLPERENGVFGGVKKRFSNKVRGLYE